MSLIVRNAKRNQPIKYIEDMHISWATVSTVTIGMGSCRDYADTFDIINAALRTVDITASGAGGLDTGVEAADTWYALHIIDDSTGVNIEAAMLSLSPTAPTLPAGYDKFRRVGWVRNNAASDILKFNQGGVDRNRTIIYDIEKSALEVLTAGNAIAWTAIDVSSLMPPTSTEFIAGVFMAMGNWNENVQFRITGSSIVDSTFKATGVANNNTRFGANGFSLFTDGSQQVDYQVSVAADVVTVAVRGYTDNL